MDEFENGSGLEDGRSAFARWLTGHLSARGTTLRRTAVEVGIDYSYLYKVVNSHKPGYAQYRRPGYSYTVRLGRFFKDVAGAVRAAGYEGPQANTQSVVVGNVGTLEPNANSTADEARELIQRLNVLLQDVDAGRSDPLSRIGAEVDISPIAELPLAAVAASAGVSVPKGDPDRADDTVADLLPGGVRTIRISGDCMEPEYRSGDVVLVRETRQVKNGDKVIAVSRESGEVMCKQFRDDRGRGRRLEPLNADAGEARHLGEWEYRIVGVVEGSIRIGR